MIYHIAEKDTWLACENKSEYCCKRYEKDRFVHCSDEHQIEGIANSMFKGRSDLVLLKIDPTKLNPKTVYENLLGGSEKFPHIYGVINKQAIIKVSELKCDKNGLFHIAKEL